MQVDFSMFKSLSQWLSQEIDSDMITAEHLQRRETRKFKMAHHQQLWEHSSKNGSPRSKTSFPHQFESLRRSCVVRLGAQEFNAKFDKLNKQQELMRSPCRLCCFLLLNLWSMSRQTQASATCKQMYIQTSCVAKSIRSGDGSMFVSDFSQHTTTYFYMNI